MNSSKTSNLSRRLLRSGSIYGLGSTLSSLGALLLTPLYTRYLSNSDYGVLKITTALTSILIIVLGLGLEGALARLYYETRADKSSFRELLSSIVITVVGFGGALSLILLIAGKTVPFLQNFNGIPFDPYIKLVVFSSFFAILTLSPMALFQAQEKAHLYATLNIVRFLVATGVSIYLVVIEHQGAVGSITGNLVGNATLAIAGLALIFRDLQFRYKFQRVKEALHYSLPLVPHMLAHWTISLSDRLIITILMGTGAVGVYSLGYDLGMGMQIIVAAFTASWGPIVIDRLTRDETTASGELGRVVTQIIASLMLIAVAMAMLSRETVMILSIERFYGAIPVMPWVVFAYFLNGLYICYVNVLFYFKQTKIIPFITGVTAIVNVLLNLWMVPRYGIIGSAWSTVLAYSITSGLTYYFSHRILPLPVNSTRLYSLGASCLLFFALLQFYYPPNPWLSILYKGSLYIAFVGVLFTLHLLPREILKKIPGVFHSRVSQR